MSIYTSVLDQNYSNISEFTGMFSHDRGSALKTIKDPLITNETLGTERARVELLHGAYNERSISFTAVYVPNLNINDVIDFNGVKWIVKEIGISYQNPKLLQSIKGVRYE